MHIKSPDWYQRATVTAAVLPGAVPHRENVLRAAETFLDFLGEGEIETIWLVGSRANGQARTDSDWDFLIVGDGFNAVEAERIHLAEAGQLPLGCRLLDVSVSPNGPDVIFDSVSPLSPPAKLLWRHGSWQ